MRRTDPLTVLEIPGVGTLPVRIVSRNPPRPGSAMLLELEHAPADAGLLAESFAPGSARILLHDREFLLIAHAVLRRRGPGRGRIRVELVRYDILR